MRLDREYFDILVNRVMIMKVVVKKSGLDWIVVDVKNIV